MIYALIGSIIAVICFALVLLRKGESLGKAETQNAINREFIENVELVTRNQNNLRADRSLVNKLRSKYTRK